MRTTATKTQVSPGSVRTQIQIDMHRRAAEALHSHATWAALATVVVLLLKYFFNIHVTSTEVLTFAGMMATYLFGSSWVAAAHIDAVSRLETKQSDNDALSQTVAPLADAIGRVGDLLAPTSGLAPAEGSRDTSSAPAEG